MKCYWLKMSDGSEVHCEGQYAGDAALIAEYMTEKTVAGNHEEFKWQADQNPNIQGLPYSCGRNLVWQHDHPVYGRSPTFCHGRPECRGKGSCPRDYACTE